MPVALEGRSAAAVQHSAGLASEMDLKYEYMAHHGGVASSAQLGDEDHRPIT